MKKNTIRKIVIGFITICVICLQNIETSMAKVDPIGDAKSGIVEVYSGFTSESGKFYNMKHSSGFVVSNQQNQAYIVTTYATVKNSENEKESYCIENGIDYSDEGLENSIQIVIKGDVKVKASIKAENEEKNFAILQVDQQINGKAPLKLGTRKSVVVGDKVYVLGFKIDAEEGDGYTQFIASDVKIYEGNIQDTGSNKEGIYYIHHSCRLTSGNTGGPLLNEEGYVIGLNDYNFNNDNYHMYYSFPIDEIREILDRYNINYKSKGRILTVNSYEKLLKQCQKILDSNDYKEESKQELKDALQNAYVPNKKGIIDMESMEASENQLVSAKQKLHPKMTMITIMMYICPIIIVILGIWIFKCFIWKKREKAKTDSIISDISNDRKKDITDSNVDEETLTCDLRDIEKTTVVSDGTEILTEPREDYLMTLERKEELKFRNRLKKAMIINLNTRKMKEIDKREWYLGKDSENNNYVVENNRTVSRKHAVIIWKNEKYYISDLGSANGTFVNGIEVKEGMEFELKNKDRIMLANEVLEFKES